MVRSLMYYQENVFLIWHSASYDAKHSCYTYIYDTDPKENATGDLEYDWSDLKCNQENVFLLVAFNPCSIVERYGKGVY